MEKMFENIKFGDIYTTMYGKQASFIKSHKHNCHTGVVTLYDFINEDGMMFTVFEDGKERPFEEGDNDIICKDINKHPSFGGGITISAEVVESVYRNRMSDEIYQARRKNH